MASGADTALAADFNAISPAPASLAAAIPTLEALTVDQTVDVSVQSVAGYLGSQDKLQALLAWAASPPAGASTASIAAANSLVFAFEHAQTFPTFFMTSAATATKMENDLTALVSPGSGITGPIDATDQTTILALAKQTVVKHPNLRVAHLQYLRDVLGLISATIPTS